MAITSTIAQRIEEKIQGKPEDKEEAVPTISIRAKMLWERAMALAPQITAEAQTHGATEAAPTATEIRQADIAARITAREDEIRELGQRIMVEIRAAADRLSSALHRLAPAPGTTYRGTCYPAKVLAGYEPGQIVAEAAFTSTTQNRQLAINNEDVTISDTWNTVLEIRGDSGRDIASFSTFKAEQEVVFDKGTRFQVVSKTWREDLDRWWIVMQEVSTAVSRPGPAGRKHDHTT